MTRKGVWDLQGVRDKSLQDLWDNPITLWGAGDAQKLGENQANVARSSPIQISGTDWSMVSISEQGCAAVKEDGTLWMWGGNEHGMLGQNNPDGVKQSSPMQIGTNTNWSFCNTQFESSGAITSSGELYVWGRNAQGYLGLNNEISYSSPVQVPGTTWAELALGGAAQGIFRKTDGTLWSCGRNNDGQLGQNNENVFSSPVQIGTQSDWVKINAGVKASWAMRDGGTLWGWGEQLEGNLGFNSPGGKFSSPKQLPGTWSEWSCSKECFWGIKTDGTLWSCGNNNEGQLGHNNKSSYSSPRQVGTDTTWSNIEGPRANSTGDPGVTAVKTDGTRWSWGVNSSSMLGLNDGTKYSSPRQVGGTKWSDTRGQLAVGLNVSMGMKETLTPSQL